MSEHLFMIVGPIGSGKSTVACILQQYGFKEEAFAKPIKEFALSIGFKNSQIYGTQIEKLEVNKFWRISGREFLQKFGSDLCRSLLPGAIPNMEMDGSTIWVRSMEQKINKYPLIVVSDGRFQDEAKLIKDYNGIIIRMNRNVDINDKTSNHISERSMNEIDPDYMIDNNSTLEELEEVVCRIMETEGLTIKRRTHNISDTSTGGILRNFKKTAVCCTETIIASAIGGCVGFAIFIGCVVLSTMTIMGNDN
jgi:hypothetical protein